VAFIRFARDKRGYENYYLVQPTTNRRGRSRTRVLYFFRTPPGVKVGLPLLDQATRRAIESSNPGVVFDWPTLLNIQIPPPDLDKWRERRRLEKEAKRAAKAEEAEEAASLAAANPPATEEPAAGELEDDADGPTPDEGVEIVSEAPGPTATAIGAQPASEAQAGPTSSRRRRRRRGRRGHDRPSEPHEP